jgi:lysylphosphatidylglycerol synthetase-like protein (DUF2156 family)
MQITDNEFPGLFQCADKASLNAQKKYFRSIACYLILLILAAILSFIENFFDGAAIKICLTLIFLATLSITIWTKIDKPDDIWYNGRAVAESVKTRTWRWIMKADPYSNDNEEINRRLFIQDLKTILEQNKNLIKLIGIGQALDEPISTEMSTIRKLTLLERFSLYKIERITSQEAWYVRKAKFNKTKSIYWFITTIVLHVVAISCLLYNIKEPNLKLPVEIIVAIASSILTWSQSKKHNELHSSYSLAAHEIILIKNEVIDIHSEEDLSEFIINCENAFSREHTQWFARKIDN